MNKTEILQGIVNRVSPYIPYLEGMTISYKLGHGFYMTRGGANFGYFKTYKHALAWFHDICSTGKPNLAAMRYR